MYNIFLGREKVHVNISTWRFVKTDISVFRKKYRTNKVPLPNDGWQLKG